MFSVEAPRALGNATTQIMLALRKRDKRKNLQKVATRKIPLSEPSCERSGYKTANAVSAPPHTLPTPSLSLLISLYIMPTHTRYRRPFFIVWLSETPLARRQAIPRHFSFRHRALDHWKYQSLLFSLVSRYALNIILLNQPVSEVIWRHLLLSLSYSYIVPSRVWSRKSIAVLIPVSFNF